MSRDARNTLAPSTVFLDGLRGLAALYVLCHHAFLWLQPGYRYGYLRHPEQYGPIKISLLLASNVFRFGHEAVLFFFVLSGFVIHLRYARKFAAGNSIGGGEYGSFMIRRFIRIYPPLVLAILVTVLLDHWGKSLGFKIYFSRTPYPVINANVSSDLRFRTFVGNLLFLMQTTVPTYGTNSPLWSLKYEWWFYVFYPALWPLLRSSWYSATSVVVILGIVVAIPVVRQIPFVNEIFNLMPVWWLGVLLAEIYCGRLTLSFRSVAWLLFLLPAAIVLHLSNTVWPIQLLWGLAFAGLIALIFAFEQAGLSCRWLERLKPMGDCSYTLYVLHAPILVLVSGWLMSRSPTGELPTSLLWPLAALLVVPLAYGFHFFSERSLTAPRQKPAIAAGTAPLPSRPALSRLQVP